MKSPAREGDSATEDRATADWAGGSSSISSTTQP
jgi:hypothetical protein